ncbi:MAG TPA: hypothetical protein VGD50_08445 [Candidatus Baltobacteraceae bacterium]
MGALRAALLLLGCGVLLVVPAKASRPLLDQPQWDRYFALSARDVSVPWQPATVRLATYSGAPVDFSVYNVDPAEVIVAGQNRPARAIDTSNRRPIARWRFTPPKGYRFEVSDVAVPLGNQEGFYVVEAHRGDATQQVWLNRTRIGLVTKESPESLLIWCVDLGSGRALSGVNVAFLVGQELITKQSDSRGLVVWDSAMRPIFALADRGASRAFVSLLPQAPLPQTIVGIRLEDATARAGGTIQFIGFVRRRVGADYRRASGDVHVTLAGDGRTIAATTTRLDASGAFSGGFTLPGDVRSGDLAVLASASGGVGGTSLHVEANTSVTLDVRSNCPCNAAKPVALTVSAHQGEAPVPNLAIIMNVIRVPHIIPPGVAQETPRWGTTAVVDQTVTTDAQGHARLDIPVPSDGLASTYGVSASSNGASAARTIAVPTAPVALSIDAEVSAVDPGEPVAFDVRGFDASDGTPRVGLPVNVRLSHGPVTQSQDLTLDDRGRARATFAHPSLGTNLATVRATLGGTAALDVTAVTVDPSIGQGTGAANGSEYAVSLDRGSYRMGERIVVTANLPDAVGDALVTLEGARTYQTRIATVVHGRAVTTLVLGDVTGDVQVAVAAVHDGAIALGSTPVGVDEPGHVRQTVLSLDRATFSPGEHANLSVRDGAASGATTALQIADARAAGAAYLDDAPDVLSIGGTTTQNPASDDPAWHAFVQPAGSKAADVYAAERPRAQQSEDLTIGVATAQTAVWRVGRSPGTTIDVTVPTAPGHYVLSLLKIGDDGDVGAGSVSFDVR